MKEPCKKIKYGTKEIAEEDLRRIRKTSKKEILPIRAYKCKICNCWHLTSKPLITMQNKIERLTYHLNESKKTTLIYSLKNKKNDNINHSFGY